MKNSTNKKKQVKVFLGFLLTLEIRKHLSSSKTWKQAMISWQSKNKGIEEVTHEGKSYIGIYVEEVTMNELRDLEKSLLETILDHCPEINPDLFRIRIFPELFVS